MNRNKFQIHGFIVLISAICLLGACSRSPKLPSSEEGYRLIDAQHSLFFKIADHQWVWGIIMPTTEVPGMGFMGTNTTVIYPRSGIRIQRLNNTVTITNATRKVTFEIKPKTIYFLTPDFTVKESKDFSGFQCVLTTRSDHETGKSWQEYELELPDDLCDRFENQK